MTITAPSTTTTMINVVLPDDLGGGGGYPYGYGCGGY
jgi:hypothetical protein